MSPAALTVLVLLAAPLRIEVAGRHVDLQVVPARRSATAPALLAWAEAGVRSVSAYLGAFPIDGARLEVVPGPGHAINGHSEIDGAGIAQVTVELGTAVTDAELRHDWVLVHELVHLALPRLDPRHHWIEEGLATYVEPLVRAQDATSGFGIASREVWSQLARGLPSGLAAGADGMDHTGSWASTYWGGALFWLLVDLDLRTRSEGRCSVQDALRGLGRAGLSQATPRPLRELLVAADRTAGTGSFARIYQQLGPKLTPMDLQALLGGLGVRSSDRETSADREAPPIELDDSAPQAALRRAITAPDPGLCLPQAAPGPTDAGTSTR